MTAHDFRIGAPANRNINNEPLTNEQIQRLAPSAFAGQPYHEMSNRYAFVPTSVVIDGMRKAGFFPVAASQSIARVAEKKNFTKHMIRFRAADAKLQFVGDSVVELALVNSHDGSSLYEEMLGAFRLACSNGLIVSEGLVHSVKIKHIGDVVDSVIENSTKLVQAAPVIGETINRWRQIELSEPEQLIFADEARKLRFKDSPNLLEAIQPVKLLQARRYDDHGNDLWHTFNRVQENAIEGGVKGGIVNNRRTRSRAVRGIDQNIDLNKALWSLGERMAELKTNG